MAMMSICGNKNLGNETEAKDLCFHGSSKMWSLDLIC
jgi:hypothetical protein